MLEVRRVYASPSAVPDGPADGVPDVVVVGAASRDLAADDPRGWRLGGSATYCSLTLARLGLDVGCLVGVDREAAEASELELLEAAGVRLRRVPLQHGPVFDNIEQDGRRRQRWLSASDRVAAGALTNEWRGARGWLLVPVAGEVGDEWAGVPGSGACVAVGWQGLLREFAASGWVERVPAAPSALVARAGLVCASLDDLAPGSSLTALRELAPAASIVLTAGDRGGIALRGDHIARYRAFEAPVVDPTGAGDVFIASLAAAWLLTGELATSRTLHFAAAAGACVVEGCGLAGVPTAPQVAARLTGRRRRDAAGEARPSGA
jgi:sugar/nucleoside kinase (ribokinase family)